MQARCTRGRKPDPFLLPPLTSISFILLLLYFLITCSDIFLLFFSLQAGVIPNMVGGIKQIWKAEGLPGFFTGYK